MPLKNKELVYLVHRVYVNGKGKKGGGDYIFDYLVKNGFRSLVVEHPLAGTGDTLVTYDNHDSAGIRLFGSGPIRWIQEIFYNVYAVAKVKPNASLVLAVDPLNFISAYIIRILYKSKIHFHAVDFTPTRFGVKLFDDFYSAMFTFAVANADIVTYVSRLAGETILKLTKGRAKGTLFHLPNSPEFDKIQKVDPAKKDKYTMVYNRTHLDDFEVDLLSKLGEDLTKMGVPIKINVLGLPSKKTENKNGVFFHGLADYETNLRYVSESYLGLAWYRHTRSNEIYADSLKIREYAAAGIPCLSNEVLSTSYEVREKESGVIVDTPEELAKAVKKLIENTSEYNRLRENALKWAKEVDKKVLLKQLFDGLLPGGEMKVILNLGANNSRLPNSINVDKIKKLNVDIEHDLEVFPYPFPENYADEVHLYHVLEHLSDSIKPIEEIYRILKPGGLLYLRVPHFSSLYAWGDITHKKAFSIYAFDIFDAARDYKKWGYTSATFNIRKRLLRYFYTWPNEPWYMQYIVKPDWPPLIGVILKPYILLMNFLINLSPEIFERFWCYWVGGAAEIYLVMTAIKHNDRR